MPAPVLLSIAAAASVLFMCVLFLIQKRTRDAGIVDLGWSAGLGMAALLYAVLGAGDAYHRWALALVACPWSFRLAYYLLIDRVLHEEEDGRYQALRARWGASAQPKFFVFFQFQAALILVFSLPFLAVAMHPGRSSAVLLAAGVLAGWAAIAGESIADAQLRRWRKNPANKGRTCRAGLWRYSRHPNYFFEWVHWWAYVILAAGGPLWWLPWMGPVLMFIFLHRVTGIPHTERQALRSRGDDYRAYQAETSAFFPWPPRKGAA